MSAHTRCPVWTGEVLFKMPLKGETELGGGGAHLNPSTWEAEAGGFLSLRPSWSTE